MRDEECLKQETPELLLCMRTGAFCHIKEKFSLLNILQFHFPEVLTRWFKACNDAPDHSFPSLNNKSSRFGSEQLLSRHVLGFAVGHHANDAYHQQRHTDASYSQHSSLVELLGLCGWKHTHLTRTFTHARTHRHTHRWIADTEQEHTLTCTHIQCERYSIYGNRFVTIMCFHPIPCTLPNHCCFIVCNSQREFDKVLSLKTYSQEKQVCVASCC